MNRNVKWLAGGLVLLLLTLLLVEIRVSRAMPQRRRSSAQARAERVVDLFRTNCARCHGADGRGDTPLGHTYKSPDFTDPEWWRKNSNITSTAQLSAIVRRGKGGMPAFGKKLTRTDIRLLVGYVRKFKS
jgi:mono/diheme cytochrome c family protein